MATISSGGISSSPVAGSRTLPSLMATISFSSFFFTFILVLLLFHLPISAISGSDGRGEEEEFTEELLLRPLPDRKVLGHFHFESTAPPSASNGRHHRLFPKAIAQLVQKFHIRELELSFTQGRWNYENWGGSDPMSSTNAKPPGVELWAIFDLPTDEIDVTWRNLTHSLSGLFCSSINFLESSTAYTAPQWGFRSNESNLRYGALPREAVCTENLTPWLKLLPCRDKAGLASLLDRPSIYRGYYHSQRLRLISTESAGIVLEQSLTIVLQPNIGRNGQSFSTDGSVQPSWSVSSLFRKKVAGQCVLSRASRIFFELEKGLVAELEKLGSGYSWSNPVFELSLRPQRVITESNALPRQSTSVLYEFSVGNFDDYEPTDVGITWKLPLMWPCPRAPFLASRFLMGSGNERGSVAISLQSTSRWSSEGLDRCTVQVLVFQVVPWYVKVYYHTLQIFIDGKLQVNSEVVEKILVSPSEDNMSPGTLELMLQFPCSMQSAALILDFDKGFLHIDEYPPDANQGFDIPSALISFPDFYSGRNYPVEDSLDRFPLLNKFQERNFVQSYTEVLLVPLTTPDFSMPYNVITFTCTVLALYFGSMLNILRRRVGEEDRLLQSQAEKHGLVPLLLHKLTSKLKGRSQEPPQSSSSSSSSSSFVGSKLLFKVIVVAVAAVIWQFYLKGS